LARIAARPAPVVIHPVIHALLAAAGREHGGASGFVLAHPFLVDALATDRLLSSPSTAALVTNTVTLTGFGGALAPNVVPSEVFAQYDVRVLPGTEPEDLLAELRARIDDVEGVTIEVLGREPASVSDADDPLFEALARRALALVDDDGRAAVGPTLSPGFTDSILLRKKGVRAYGFAPFVVTREELATFHGDGERISKRNVVRGLEALVRAIVDVTAEPDTLPSP
jgi:carboxypeptidase PM20D1